MGPARLVAVVLIVVGGLGLVYGGFTFTRERHRADLGDLHLEFNETGHLGIPIWVGVGALVGGVLLLAAARHRGG